MDLNSRHVSFKTTGNAKIDTVLHAVAKASGTFHDTSLWDEQVTATEMGFKHLQGETPIEWIQNAAIAAASQDAPKHTNADMLIALSEGREIEWRTIGEGGEFVWFNLDEHDTPIRREVLDQLIFQKGNPDIEFRIKE